ncbi:MAG: transcription termination/antitermination protein NusA [SAR202 cluster bacterium]|nr:transcription termination/antitermination protein NusA [SAR202 cluster bacterium]
MKSDFLIALTQLAAERHLPKEEVLKAIEAALASAFKKDNWGDGLNVSVKLNPNTGDIRAYVVKTAVEDVQDSKKEIALKEAKTFKRDVKAGDTVEVESLSHQASRIAAQTAKQVVLQRLREAERELVYGEFVKRVDDIISAVVGQMDPAKGITLELDRAEALLTPEEQVITERYRRGQRLKVYVLEVRRNAKGPEIIVSRSHKNLLKRLFELEVPEVYNGIVEIRSIAREAGSRSKVAVVAMQEGVDPVGSCIGMRGNRIQNIVNELQGEKIDVVRWDRDLKRFISNALSPAEVVHVEATEKDKSAVVVVPERQLSLAIGKEGQNARLAAKLTGWHLDIKSMAEWETLKAQIKLDSETAAAVVEERAREEAKTKADAVAEAARAKKTPAPVEEKAEPEKPKVAVPVLEEALAEILAQDKTAPAPEEKVAASASVEEELAALGLEEQETEDAEEAEEEVTEVQEMGEDIWKTPQLTPDAGKIRFAEDILDYDRGGAGRRDKRGGRAPNKKKGGQGNKARPRVGGGR